VWTGAENSRRKTMKIDFDVIENIIEKYGSRKALSAIMGMWLISAMTIPETELWLKGCQIAGIAVLGVAAVVCQWNLDKKDE
jgi:hypothetical protein